MDSFTPDRSPHLGADAACASAGGGVAASLPALGISALLVIPDHATPCALGVRQQPQRDHAAMAAVLYARGADPSGSTTAH